MVEEDQIDENGELNTSVGCLSVRFEGRLNISCLNTLFEGYQQDLGVSTGSADLRGNGKRFSLLTDH